MLNPINKRNKVLAKMKKEQAHIVYLQETHLNDKEHKKLAFLVCFSLHINQGIGGGSLFLF